MPRSKRYNSSYCLRKRLFEILQNFMRKCHYVLPRDFPLFYSAEFRIFPRNSVPFLMQNLSGELIQETLDFFFIQNEAEFKNINFTYIYLNDPCSLFPLKFSLIPYSNRSIRKRKNVRNSVNTLTDMRFISLLTYQ
jgi:hypothetical protein